MTMLWGALVGAYVGVAWVAFATVWRYEAANHDGPSLLLIPAILAYAVFWPVAIVLGVLLDYNDRRRA